MLVAPITSQLKRTPYHVRFTHDGIEYPVIISQVRLISTRRLRRRIFRMPEDMFGEVLSALQQMIGQETTKTIPALRRGLRGLSAICSVAALQYDFACKA